MYNQFYTILKKIVDVTVIIAFMNDVTQIWTIFTDIQMVDLSHMTFTFWKLDTGRYSDESGFQVSSIQMYTEMYF